jgi:2-C-methyl-D-erythritol 4-phosphate cytidylyltransferase/2-C-methyl-D-erythritol 2,4-cyclodiphosphate synthase
MPAAGTGVRLCNTERKAWVPLAGRPLLTYALETFRAHPAIDEIILVVGADDMERTRALMATGPARVTEKAIIGGAVRRDSVWRGVQEVSAGTEIVLIHDAARPFVSPRVIDACIAAIAQHGAAVVAQPVVDTLKRATPDGDVAATVPRVGLWGAQTPQGARTGLLHDAYARAVAEGWDVTDDAGVLERAGHRVHLVEGEAMNFKITRPDDLTFAERLLAMPTRTGFGYDVHRLVPDRALVLGGVTIPWDRGLLGHSDADVLTHAIMDALLGAAALGDIGQHFPDTDARFRGINSVSLLATVRQRVEEAGYLPWNIDATVAAQAPKLAPHLPAMRAALAATLGLDPGAVSVKATTTEGLGFVGTGEGMAAYATASIVPAVRAPLVR